MTISANYFNLTTFAFPVVTGGGPPPAPPAGTVDLPLLHSPADVLRWLLVQLGLANDPTQWGGGSGSPWPAFTAGEPGSPDNLITTYDTTAVADGRAMTTGETWQHWGCQIRVRGSVQPLTYAMTEAIRIALNEQVYATTVDAPNDDGTFATYMVMNLSGNQLMTVGRETPSSKRVIFTLNVRMSMRRIA